MGLPLALLSTIPDAPNQQVSSLQSATRQLGDNVTRIETLHSRALNTVPDSAEAQVRRINHSFLCSMLTSTRSV